MLTRDPFRPPARHSAPPRRTIRNALLTAAATAAVLGAGVLAAPHVHAATRTTLGATVAHAATIATERFTPSPAPLTRTRAGTGYTRADRRACRALARFDAAGIPGPVLLRDLARAGSIAEPRFETAAAELVMRVVAGKTFYAADTRFQRLCGLD